MCGWPFSPKLENNHAAEIEEYFSEDGEEVGERVCMLVIRI
jgi:hypothetical protein